MYLNACSKDSNRLYLCNLISLEMSLISYTIKQRLQHIGEQEKPIGIPVFCVYTLSSSVTKQLLINHDCMVRILSTDILIQQDVPGNFLSHFAMSAKPFLVLMCTQIIWSQDEPLWDTNPFLIMYSKASCKLSLPSSDICSQHLVMLAIYSTWIDFIFVQIESHTMS